MSARCTLQALALLAVGSVGLDAQTYPMADRAGSDSSRHDGWLGRVSVVARAGVFNPTGRSDLYTLLDNALDMPSALRPAMAGGEVHVRVRSRWHVVGGLEWGERTNGSASRVIPAANTMPITQQTRLALSRVTYVGALVDAWRWRRDGERAPDRLRVQLGAGAGTQQYSLRQWGGFVDVPRDLAFADDLQSGGHGRFGYGSAALIVPLNAALAAQADVRRVVGSAPMTADYAGFERLDLSGTRFGLGLVLQPSRLRR